MWDWTWMWRVTKSKPSSSLPSPSSSPSLKLSSITNQPSTREHHPENIEFWFLSKVSLCLSASTKLQTIRHLPLESWFATGLLRELCLVNTYQLGRHLPHCLTLEHCLDRRNVIFLLCSCCLKSLVQYITSFIYTYIHIQTNSLCNIVKNYLFKVANYTRNLDLYVVSSNAFSAAKYKRDCIKFGCTANAMLWLIMESQQGWLAQSWGIRSVQNKHF